MTPLRCTLPPGWTLDVYEREDGVWVSLIGPDHQGACLRTDPGLIRAQILRQYIAAVRQRPARPAAQKVTTRASLVLALRAGEAGGAPNSLLTRAADEIERLERLWSQAVRDMDSCACEWEVDEHGERIDRIATLCGAHQQSFEARSRQENLLLAAKSDRLQKACDEADDLLCCAEPSRQMESATPEDWEDQVSAWRQRNGYSDAPA